MGRRALIWRTHLRTVVWLCWRLWQRRWERQGSGYRSLGSLAVLLAVLAGCLSFLLALLLGWALLPQAEHDFVLLTWAGLIAAFVFTRVIGAFGDLQRGDGLPLGNLLHLPFSLHQVFLLNFALSQLTPATVIFLPAFLGLAIACTVALDVRNIVLIPASLSLILCVAALMYQVQGWIASAAGTKRRRVLIGYFVCTVLVAVLQMSYFLYLTQGIASEPEASDAIATSSEPAFEGWTGHQESAGLVERVVAAWLGVTRFAGRTRPLPLVVRDRDGRLSHDYDPDPRGRLSEHSRAVSAWSDGNCASPCGCGAAGAAREGAEGAGVTRGGHFPRHAQALVPFRTRCDGVSANVGAAGLVRVPLVSKSR